MARIHTRKAPHKLSKNFTSRIKGIMNFGKNRQRIMKKDAIEKENKKFLQRLQNSSPTYNVRKWENDRKRSKKYANLRCQHPYVLDEKRSKAANRSNDIGSVRRFFGTNKASEDLVNTQSIMDDHSVSSRINPNPYNYDSSILPELPLPNSSTSFATNNYDYCPPPEEQPDYISNMKRLEKIRESVKSVDQFLVVKRKKLYQGIVIISK
eukprot:CAMPEP_0197001428 /NCGR_PEP_ID=MMETSP1380-20130617/6132_1 /TAXON_ID=5936 /ORGANISM="Euplotes crassus, Strain CT5" /LENGTH=208 /DNA_ID=CAMNT_0042419095 /DNA_START=163 /DNA_END=789 /DNA_ORIENTATION=+